MSIRQVARRVRVCRGSHGRSRNLRRDGVLVVRRCDYASKWGDDFHCGTVRRDLHSRSLRQWPEHKRRGLLPTRRSLPRITLLASTSSSVRRPTAWCRRRPGCPLTAIHRAGHRRHKHGRIVHLQRLHHLLVAQLCFSRRDGEQPGHLWQHGGQKNASSHIGNDQNDFTAPHLVVSAVPPSTAIPVTRARSIPATAWRVAVAGRPRGGFCPGEERESGRCAGASSR